MLQTDEESKTKFRNINKNDNTKVSETSDAYKQARTIYVGMFNNN